MTAHGGMTTTMPDLSLTVLGSTGGFPAAGTATSGYLVEAGTTHLVLDLGSGTLSRLLGVLDIEDIDAVILSHLHFDHCADLFVLQYAIQSEMARKERDRPLSVFAPDSPEAVQKLIDDSPFFERIPIRDGMEVVIGDIAVRFFAVRHAVETYAVRLTSDSGETLFYTGDTGYFDGLSEYAEGADMILADTAFENGTPREGKPLMHMTPEEAENLRKTAHAGALLATHLPNRREEREQVEKEIDISMGNVVQELGQYFVNSD